jgi:hypothetical protein
MCGWLYQDQEEERADGSVFVAAKMAWSPDWQQEDVEQKQAGQRRDMDKHSLVPRWLQA